MISFEDLIKKDSNKYVFLSIKNFFYLKRFFFFFGIKS